LEVNNMKTVKSLLLGTAAVVVGSAAVQAADLPAAEPVEYVRVCDAYGAGFFFIPGTDTCLQISGFARSLSAYRSNAFSATGGGVFEGDYSTFAAPTYTFPGVGPGGVWARPSNNLVDPFTISAEFRLRVDARSRTDFGVLRSFIETGWTSYIGGGNGTGLTVRWAVVQWGPITAGLAPSFFNYDGGNQMGTLIGDRGSRAAQLAYTATFGGGFAATIALEAAQQGSFVSTAGFNNIGGTATSLALNAGAVHRGQQLPALVGQLRVVQGWGNAQLSGVVFQSRYTDGACVGSLSGVCNWNTTNWAVRGGVTINLPALGAGSNFRISGAYGQGATQYVTGIGAFTARNYWQTSFLAAPGAVVNETVLNRIDSWSVWGHLAMFFTPAVRGTLYAGYGAFDYRGAAAQLPGNTILLDSSWTVGGQILVNPVRNLDLSLDVFYTQTRWSANNRALGEVSGYNNGGWGGILRIQRNF
jgi:hypothetical protein